MAPRMAREGGHEKPPRASAPTGPLEAPIEGALKMPPRGAERSLGARHPQVAPNRNIPSNRHVATTQAQWRSLPQAAGCAPHDRGLPTGTRSLAARESTSASIVLPRQNMYRVASRARI
eukprot:2896220-Pyramimonas_sp.AAC.2